MPRKFEVVCECRATTKGADRRDQTGGNKFTSKERRWGLTRLITEAHTPHPTWENPHSRPESYIQYMPGKRTRNGELGTFLGRMTGELAASFSLAHRDGLAAVATLTGNSGKSPNRAWPAAPLPCLKGAIKSSNGLSGKGRSCQ